MAKVVNKSQQVTSKGLAPKGHYSRVVSLNMEVPADGQYWYAVVPKLGQKFWLLEVKVWCFPKEIAAGQATHFEVRSGLELPPRVGPEVWGDNILPVVAPVDVPQAWYFDDGRNYYSWRMDMLFTAVPRYLGIRAMRPALQGDDGIYASFKISEG